jgi:proteasome lid subunit RPN8/RPN11
MIGLAGASISAGVNNAILAHASAEAPNEACGLVAGQRGSNRGTVFHPARNELASPYRFDVHPADLVRILDDIDRAGHELVAIFHSHPCSAAAPSALDRREARYAVPHLIAGKEGGDDGPRTLRAWQIEGSSVQELEIRVIESDQQSVAWVSSTCRATGSRTMSTAHEPSSLPER